MGGGLWFWAKEVLADLAVWGFPETFPENLPPQALLPPFPPFFSPLILSTNSFTPQTPSSTSLVQAFISPHYLSYPPFLLQPPHTLSEHLRNPFIGSLKRPFLGLFSGFPPNPLKGPKTPLLGPFWPLFHPYPTLSKIPIYWRVTTLPSFIGKPKHGTF